jgi:hypothetical protein
MGVLNEKRCNEIYKEDVETLIKIKELDNNLNEFINNNSNPLKGEIIYGGNKKFNLIKKIKTKKQKTRIHKKQNTPKNKTYKKISRTLSAKNIYKKK